MMRRAFAIGLIALLACGTAPVERQDIGRASSAIINGAPDTTHPAVVALYIGTSEQAVGYCSGTIVKVDPSTHVGWVATAAHCVNEGPVSYVYAGPDYGHPESRTEYPVIDSAFDSRFDATKLTNGYDFGIVRFAGADATTPAIPLTTAPDGLATGSSVASVGYGMTSKPSLIQAPTSSRNVVTKSLGYVDDVLLTYDGRDSGGCFGDSGGPLIAGDGAASRVVGIHSYKSGDCDSEFGSGRVTSGLDFYATELAKPLPPESCATCRIFAQAPGGGCAARLKECLADAKCKGFAECYSGGGSYTECSAKWSLGEGPYSQVYYCPCFDACATLCKGDAYCVTAPRCGLPAEDTCGLCLNSACCDAENECAKDPQCYACMRSSATSCPANDPWAKLATCAASKCASDCPDLRPPAVPDAGASAPASTSPAPAAPDAGATPPAASDDGGCHASRRDAGPNGFAILLALVALVRLRPYRSARR